MHRVHFRAEHQTVCHVRLIGDDCQEKACPLQSLKAGGSLRINPEVRQPPWGVAAPVTDVRNNDHPIPIEKHGWY